MCGRSVNFIKLCSWTINVCIAALIFSVLQLVFLLDVNTAGLERVGGIINSMMRLMVVFLLCKFKARVNASPQKIRLWSSIAILIFIEFLGVLIHFVIGDERLMRMLRNAGFVNPVLIVVFIHALYQLRRATLASDEMRAAAESEFYTLMGPGGPLTEQTAQVAATTVVAAAPQVSSRGSLEAEVNTDVTEAGV